MQLSRNQDMTNCNQERALVTSQLPKFPRAIGVPKTSIKLRKALLQSIPLVLHGLKAFPA